MNVDLNNEDDYMDKKKENLDTSKMNAKEIKSYAKEQTQNNKIQRQQRDNWNAVYYDAENDPKTVAYTHDVKRGNYAERVATELPKIVNKDLDSESRHHANQQIMREGKPHSRVQQIKNIKEMAQVYKSMLPATDSSVVKKKYQNRANTVKALKQGKKLNSKQKALVQRADIVKDSVNRTLQNTSTQEHQKQVDHLIDKSKQVGQQKKQKSFEKSIQPKENIHQIQQKPNKNKIKSNKLLMKKKRQQGQSFQ